MMTSANPSASDLPVMQARDVGVKFKDLSRREEIKSLTFDFLTGKLRSKKEFWALKSINFSVFKGEIIGVIGANGAGKSTLCRVIAKILAPDTGSIHVQGLISALLSLGTGFKKDLTGAENIYLNAMMLGFTRKAVDKLYKDIVDFSGVEDFIHQPIKTYSSGMKSRLGFSIAAMLQPDVLVLDESLGAGDAEFSERAADKMRDLLATAKMVIIVSHALEFIEEKCSRAIWIDKGSIRAEGMPEEVCNQYRQAASKPVKKKKIIANIQRTETVIGDEIVLKADQVGLKYRLKRKEFWALRDISFTLRHGEIIGVIGHNGAGKSTLCKLMTGILHPDAGRLEIMGRTTALLGFGTGFNRQLTAADNIYLNGLMLGFSKAKIRAMYDDIVKFSGLGGHINKPVKDYSSGMSSRLGFSIATMINPELFIIDEALSAGDLAFYEKATERIQSLISMSKAVVLVTHSMRFVEQVCTRVIWIDRGRLKYDGAPGDIIEKYLPVKEKK